MARHGQAQGRQLRRLDSKKLLGVAQLRGGGIALVAGEAAHPLAQIGGGALEAALARLDGAGLEDTIKGFKGIVAGDYDDLPEAAFYMVGPIEEAVEKARKMAAEAA